MLYQLKIKKRLDGLINWVTSNQNNVAIPETEKFLYRVFGGQEYDGFDYYDQAKKIILRTSTSPRKLETRMQFDPDRATLPTVHVTLPADSPGKDNGLGISQYPDYYENTSDTYNNTYRRSFSTNYDLIISSSNPNETEILYELLMHLFIAAADTLNQDFDNFVYKGREVQMNNSLVPDRIFTKVVSISVDFRRRVPSIGSYGQFIEKVSAESVDIGFIKVFTPDLGDSFNGDETVTLTWRSTGDFDGIKIEFFDGTSWDEIESSVPDINSYDYILPTVNTDEAKFRVTTVGGDLEFTDTSEEFKIKTI